MCDCDRDYFCNHNNNLEKTNSYYIETSRGKIPFTSIDVENIRIRSRTVDEYINFIPTNNTKFLKFADKFSIGYMGLNIYSERTKNGVFLKLATYEYTAEYKIFKVKK